MSNRQLFHIIWTTHNEYPVWDKNGNWQTLADVYEKLRKQQIHCHFSRELPTTYSHKHPQKDRLLLDGKAMVQLKHDIETLCREGGDRIIDGLEINMLHIHESGVEMLVLAGQHSLAPKIARLKSRTATLLSFKFPETYSGKGTWGKAYWYATILNREDLAVSILKNYRKPLPG